MGNLDNLLKEFTSTVVPFVKNECKANLIVTCGQCWGGNASFKAGAMNSDDIRGIVSLHGAKINEADCNALKKPVYYVQTDGDFDKDTAEGIIGKKVDIGKLCKFEKSTQAHGFTSSGGKYKDENWVKTYIEPVVVNIVAFCESVFADSK